jgi:aspartyl protease family protein
MRAVITFAAAALAAGMIVPRYVEHMRVEPAGVEPAPRALTAAPGPEQSQSASSPNSVEVPHDAFGRFRVDGRVNGRGLGFMIDTGASIIALTADAAAQLGIHPGASDYRVRMTTANGIVRAAPATLETVEIGDIAVHDVAAVVMPDGALSENLLGMSFLSRLRHFDYTDGRMVLEQ